MSMYHFTVCFDVLFTKLSVKLTKQYTFLILEVKKMKVYAANKDTIYLFIIFTLEIRS